MKDYESLSQTDYNDCAVRAVSALTDLPMAEAYKALEEQGRKHKQPTYTHMTRGALHHLGFSVQNVLITMQNVEKRHGRMTVRGLPEFFSTGRYLVISQGHAMGMVSGTIKDWAADSKRPITKLYKITDIRGW